MITKFKILNKNATIPTRESASAAGYDLHATNDHPIEIAPHKTEKIGCGIAMAIPEGYFGAIFARSGLATKEGLRPANCVGIVDSDYRGEIIVALHNDTDMPRVIEPGVRIAQIIILPYMVAGFQLVDELDETGRGSGGFGSTGT